MDKQLWPGWETAEKLGNGGFGSVYRIERTDISGTFSAALKVISIPASQSDYDFYADSGMDEGSVTAIFRNQLNDIMNEFQLMRRFKGTSNIVSYEEHRIVEHEDGRGWDVLIKMELLTPLPKYYAAHGMDEAEVLRLAKDIASALLLCEKENIIHRDIKPQNIFVNDLGHFKLGDFGIARTMEHTMQATKTGTYAYMAPEVYAGKSYNSTVDIYSLGLVLFWLLNERRQPFLPLDCTLSQSMINSAQYRRLSGEPLPETKNGSAAFNAVIRKACAFDPAERYPSASAFLAALEQLTLTEQNSIPVSPSTPIDEEQTFGASLKDRQATGGPTMSAFSPPAAENGNSDTWEDTGTISAFGNGPKNATGVPHTPAHTYFCKKCGAPVSTYNTYCQKCRSEEEPFKRVTATKATTAASNSASSHFVHETALCPLCMGTSKRTFLDDKGSYYDAPCTYCHGAGRVFTSLSAYADIKQAMDKQREEAQAGGVVKPDCPVCHGLGSVTMLTESKVAFTKKVFYRSQPVRCPQCYSRNPKKGPKKIPMPPDHEEKIRLLTARNQSNQSVNDVFDKLNFK